MTDTRKALENSRQKEALERLKMARYQANERLGEIIGAASTQSRQYTHDEQTEFAFLEAEIKRLDGEIQQKMGETMGISPKPEQLSQPSAPRRKAMTLKAYRALSPEEAKQTKVTDREYIHMLQEWAKEGFKDLHESLDELWDVIGGMDKAIESLKNKGIRYRGVFQRADQYERGDVVTYKGSAWVCVDDIGRGTPGDNTSWQLLVKSGRE